MSPFSYTSKTLAKHTKEYTVTISWDHIALHKEEAFAHLAQHVSAPGFRKGKAPKDIIAKYIDPEKVYDQAIRNILPELYKELIEKDNLKPVTSPSVDLLEAKENEPWKLTIKIAEIPEVTLKDYKKKVTEAHLKAQPEITATKDKPTTSKKEKESASKEPEKETQKSLAPLSTIFTILLENAECEIPEMLILEETNRRLSQLVDDTRRVGLTLEQYLTSKNTDLENYKKQLTKESEDMYKLEFILAKIAEVEKIVVEKSELDAVLGTAQTDSEKDAVRANMSWYETLLRKQKVLDFLNSL